METFSKTSAKEKGKFTMTEKEVYQVLLNYKSEALRKGEIGIIREFRLGTGYGNGSENRIEVNPDTYDIKASIAAPDMVNSGEIPSQKWIAGYLGDIHNYMFLLEAIFEEERPAK